MSVALSQQKSRASAKIEYSRPSSRASTKSKKRLLVLPPRTVIEKAQSSAPGRSYHFALLETAWGHCGICWELPVPERPFASTGQGALLCRILTPGLAPAELRQQLQRIGSNVAEVLPDHHGHFHAETVPSWFGELRDLLTGYYSNALRSEVIAADQDHWSYWNPRLDLSQITTFQRAVLAAVARLPRGRTAGYGDIARALGKPQAARAVGAALAANPWPVLIPCHRVVGRDGALTGFTAPGGVNAKKRMLILEKALLPNSGPK